MLSRLEPPVYVSSFGAIKEWLLQAFRWNAQAETGVFEGFLSGMTASTSADINYTVTADTVLLTVGVDITGTSNATTMTLTDSAGTGSALPEEIIPTGTRNMVARIVDNSATYAYVRAVIDSTGIITFYSDANAGAFTAANTKGLLACTMVYAL